MGVGQRPRERGAALIEMGIAVSVLFLLIFATIDFAWVFAQNVDAKNAAREGGRLAAVNGGPGSPFTSSDDVIAKVRERSTELKDSDTAVAVSLEDSTGDGAADDRGDTVVVCLRYPIRALSGMGAPFLSGDLSTKVVMRMEKVPQFTSGTSTNWGSATCAS